jgi:hypothetical protein
VIIHIINLAAAAAAGGASLRGSNQHPHYKSNIFCVLSL